MNTTYDIVCLVRSPERYIEKTLTSPSFTAALFLLISENSIDSSVFQIYCRDGRGNLHYMARYDGLTVIIHRGMRFSRILRTSEDRDYSYSPEGFRRVYLRDFPSTFCF